MDCESRLRSCSLRFIKHVVLCTAVAAVFRAQAETSKTSSCSASSVYEGEPATITCDFGRPLNPSLTTLSVDYQGPDGKQKSIVNCFPNEANTSNCIYYKGWLRLRNETIVTNPIIVDIPNATRTQSGAFSCHLVPPSGPELPCVLDVKERVSQSPPTQQPELPGATRQTDKVTRTTAGGTQNTTDTSALPHGMSWTDVNGVASTEAGIIAAAVVIVLAALALIICAVAYIKCKRFRKIVRTCCRRAVRKKSKSGTHVPPRDERDEPETRPLDAVHYGSDRNGEAVNNGDVHTQIIPTDENDEDWEMVDLNLCLSDQSCSVIVA